MQEEINKINNSLYLALASAIELQKKVFEAEGDSELNRKLTSYLIPNLSHWITGSQAGSMKDLNDLIERTNRDK